MAECEDLMAYKAAVNAVVAAARRQRLMVSEGIRIRPLRADDVCVVEANGYYAEIPTIDASTGDKKPTIEEALADLVRVITG